MLGGTTNPDGTRKHDAPAKTHHLVGYGNAIHDYSTVTCPALPSFYSPMPRDLGHAALTPPTLQSRENVMRQGPAECDKCHGDPDDNGPLPAPAQGTLAYRQPSIAACASCHDDWVPENLYTANAQTMPIQRDNASCVLCHRESGTTLDVIDAHRHPLADSAVARGLRFDVTAVNDVGGTVNGRF